MQILRVAMSRSGFNLNALKFDLSTDTGGGTGGSSTAGVAAPVAAVPVARPGRLYPTAYKDTSPSTWTGTPTSCRRCSTEAVRPC